MDLIDGQLNDPSPSMSRVCDAIDEGIGQFLSQRSKLVIGEFEADVEALSIFNLCIRHVEALLQIARNEITLVPAAYTLARAAFECAVRAAWLVDEDDPYRREVRYIAHLDGDISALRRTAERSGDNSAENSKRMRAEGIESFRNGVAVALEQRGMTLLKQTPNFAAMLKSIGGESLYTTYIETSQYAHGGHQATWLYRSGGLGTRRKKAEPITESHWILPLRMCWLALSVPGDILLRRVSMGTIPGWSTDLRQLIDVVFRDFASGQAHSIN